MPKAFVSRDSRRLARLASCHEITKSIALLCAVKLEVEMEDFGKGKMVEECAAISDAVDQIHDAKNSAVKGECSTAVNGEDLVGMEVDGPHQEPPANGANISSDPEPAVDDLVFLNNFMAFDEIDVENLKFDFTDLCVDNTVEDVPSELPSELAVKIGSSAIVPAIGRSSGPFDVGAMSHVPMNAPGFRTAADADLVKASKGEDKQRSANNDRWALRRVDTLRAAMGCDMSIGFGDLTFNEQDILLSNLFARVVKVKGGGTYPASSLMNMLGGYNRIICRASDVRTVNGVNNNVVERSFQIKNHPAFTRTRLTLKAALTKGQKEGANKKPVKKVHVVSEAMEEALFGDIEFQMTDNRGCQKLLALLLLLRVGLRGGDELWDLDRDDVTVEVDALGREYVKFEERQSKNNCVSLDRYQAEQFRKAFHSYEDRFVMCVKQYKRHLPPLGEGVKRDLFLGCITNPVSNVWFNRANKVGKDTSHKWLKNALELVGIPGDLISNKSGRATLITRLASSGVPDDVGRLITGHHTVSGYSRYDRTQALKMEAAQLCSFNPAMTYDMAYAQVSKKFNDEQLVGSSANLNPLVDNSERAQQVQLALMAELQVSEVPVQQEAVVVTDVSMADYSNSNTSGESTKSTLTVRDCPQTIARWHKSYDGIDWDAAMRSDPRLARALGLRTLNQLGGNTFSNLSNCTIQICVGAMDELNRNVDNKENAGVN